jgi:MFS family permease
MTDETLRANPDASGKVLTVLLTSVAYFMVALDTLVVVTALPSIHRDLGGNVGVLQWTVNAYVLTFGAASSRPARQAGPAPGPSWPCSWAPG